jgi:hypothetical protein
VRIEKLPSLERDEAIDALEHGTLKWSWLMLGWATETGRGIAKEDYIQINQEEFLESLAGAQRFVDLEYSAPLQALRRRDGRQPQRCRASRGEVNSTGAYRRPT